jgi:hypothetical protein
MIARRLRRLHSDESGQVLWLFVVSGLALVVLSALVFNTGRQATRKMEMQNAVDASAVSGAMWMARGMNIVSMNNVAMTEILGLIANLRAIEQAVPINTVILNAEDVAAKALMADPFTFPAGFVLEVGVVLGKIETQIVKVVSDNLKEFTRPTSGYLWQFMKALSYFSEAVTDATPAMGFVEAIRVGKLNIQGLDPQAASPGINDIDPSHFQLPEGALLLPNPAAGNWRLPARKGDFQELCDPTRSGTQSSSPVDTRGYEPLLGYAHGVGPFQKYKDWISKMWLPSIVSGIPAWYRPVADWNLEVFCHTGAVPSMPKIPIKTTDWREAVNSGGKDFHWTHSWVYSKEIEQYPDQPAPNVNFEPIQSSPADHQQQANQLAHSGGTPDQISQDALQQAQKDNDAKPKYQDDRVAASTYDSEPLTEDRNYRPPVESPPIRSWVWTSVSKSSQIVVKQQPAPAQPVEKRLWTLREDRYTFQYATIDKSFDDQLKDAKNIDSSSGYPQPFHFVVDEERLTDAKKLPQAVQTLQYLAIAHRKADDQPWLGGLKVSIRGEKHPVFENPNQLGTLTYAQVQVYNPTSWDLYTQDWHVKLVPASLLEQFTEGGAGGATGLMKGASAVIHELNAH